MNGTYHNHTTWSDGIHTPEEIIEKAISLSFEQIGITDHYYTTKGEINCIINEQIENYISMIEKLRTQYPQIKILSGLEIDTSLSNPHRFNLPYDLFNKLDYVLFEYVDEFRKTEKELNITSDTLRNFTLEELIKSKKNLTCKVGLAHPNMLNLIQIYGAEQLAKLLAENKIFVDVCGSKRNARRDIINEQRGFTLNAECLGEEFEQAARTHKVKFIPSSDTHQDSTRDAMKDTLNAIKLIKLNNWQFQKF
ncbi:hypothetical protein COV11_02495 [Candidatus Woesearchaeota archaeon CG10_big_fil_rev_8_21_14_0_10_30_7]|nr:MAG: hypothetical protein COV11_02495 [Candidatus Woesearchaeota archaeon CG10_big_fil_rev_8_21_14_0_10_30_7]